MKSILLTVTILLTTCFAEAGFMLRNQNQNIDIVSTLQCDSGLVCTKQEDRAIVKVNAALPPVAATATTITSSQCGQTFVNSGAVLMNLPEASGVLGCKLTFVTLNASNFDINPDNADTILTLTNAAGDMIRNATVGNSVVLQAVSASQWAVIGTPNGTWADNN